MESSAAASASRIPALFFSLRSNRLPIATSSSPAPPLAALRAVGSRSGHVPCPPLFDLSSPPLPIHPRCRSLGQCYRAQGSQSQSFFRSVLSEKVYLSRNPTVKSALELVSKSDGNPVCYDHFAFRTFGVDGNGIDSISKFFLDFGYMQREELRFPAKKLRALWFAPPEIEYGVSVSFLNVPFPRIFISELLVDEMCSQSQEIIRKYVTMSGNGNKYAALASALGCLPWEKPIYSDYQQLYRESEYSCMDSCKWLCSESCNYFCSPDKVTH